MRIIVKPMRTGKTHEAINHCAENGGYMVCINDNEAARVAKSARQMGLKIPYPLTFREAMNKSYYAAGIRKLHIDNADMFLQHMFNDVVLESISITGCQNPPKESAETRVNNLQQLKDSISLLNGLHRDIETENYVHSDLWCGRINAVIAKLESMQ